MAVAPGGARAEISQETVVEVKGNNALVACVQARPCISNIVQLTIPLFHDISFSWHLRHALSSLHHLHLHFLSASFSTDVLRTKCWESWSWRIPQDAACWRLGGSDVYHALNDDRASCQIDNSSRFHLDNVVDAGSVCCAIWFQQD